MQIESRSSIHCKTAVQREHSRTNDTTSSFISL